MIKYIDINGYDNLGELAPFTHFYQFMQSDAEVPLTIIVHAYECDAVVFKGYLFNKTRSFEVVPLTEHEKSKLEDVVGNITEVTFSEFIKGTILEDEYLDVVDKTNY